MLFHSATSRPSRSKRLPRAAGVPLMERLGQRALGGRLRERPFAQSRVLPRLDALDERLPARCSRGWYDAGIAVGGTRATQRRRAPTIEPRELVKIVRRGGAGSTEGAALLGVLCFSGLRVGEGRTLRWPSLRWNGAAESWEVYGSSSLVRRRSDENGSVAGLLPPRRRLQQLTPHPRPPGVDGELMPQR